MPYYFFNTTINKSAANAIKPNGIIGFDFIIPVTSLVTSVTFCTALPDVVTIFWPPCVNDNKEVNANPEPADITKFLDIPLVAAFKPVGNTLEIIPAPAPEAAGLNKFERILPLGKIGFVLLGLLTT